MNCTLNSLAILATLAWALSGHTQPGHTSPPRGETPPKGPPWFTECHAAKLHALKTRTPVFVYFTKTV